MKDLDQMESWRLRIDELDSQILDLFNERSRCALAIGAVKKRLGLAIYDPEREAAIVRRILELNRGPLQDDAVKRLFERIIDESRRIERGAEGPSEPAQAAGKG